MVVAEEKAADGSPILDRSLWSHVNIPTRLIVSIELNHLHPTGAPYIEPVNMSTPTPKAKESFLDDDISVLSEEAVGASSAKRVFRAVGTTIALVRVSAPFYIYLWTLMGNPNRTRWSTMKIPRNWPNTVSTCARS